MKISSWWRSILWVVVLILLLYMPYATFLNEWIQHLFIVAGYPLPTLLVKLLTGWKEVLVLVGSVILVWGSLMEQRLPWRFNLFDYLVGAFALIGLLWGAWLIHRPAAIIFGFRYDFSFALYYFIARAIILKKDQLQRVVTWLVYSSIPIMLFGIAQTFILPLHFMERFGYSSKDVSATGNPLPPYHLIADHVVRAMATFPGPNSLAMYCVGVLFLLFWLYAQNKQRKWIIWYAAVVLLVLLITFSRAHLVALAVALLVVGSLKVLRAYSLRLQTTVVVGIVLLSIVAGLVSTLFLGQVDAGQSRTGLIAYILHDTSSEVHRIVVVQALQDIKKHPLGSGLGTSGLATTNTGGPVFNPESWYIQITQELGLVGLVLVLILIIGGYSFLMHLRQELEERLPEGWWFAILGFTAILVSATFLPAWFEVMSISWWLLIGLLFSMEKPR